MDEIQVRLQRLVDQRPYVFRDTPRKLAEQFLREERTILGLSEDEVADIEASLEVVFPEDFRSFLLRMGERSNKLFPGGHARAENFEEYRAYLEELIDDAGIPSFLTPRTVVFLMHEGDRFSFFEADNPTHAAVWTYGDGDERPSEVAPNFVAYLQLALDRAEQLDADIRSRGGYYLTVDQAGRTRPMQPASNEGQRPLDEGDVWP